MQIMPSLIRYYYIPTVAREVIYITMYRGANHAGSVVLTDNLQNKKKIDSKGATTDRDSDGVMLCKCQKL